MVMKKRIFLISHGRLAEGMANALGMLVGDIGELQTFGLMPGEAPETIAFAIEQVILQNPEDRVFVVADLLCGLGEVGLKKQLQKESTKKQLQKINK